MDDPRMQRMLCTLCNKHYAYEIGGEAVDCPWCQAANLVHEREMRIEAERQRDMLAEAINLKRLLVSR